MRKLLPKLLFITIFVSVSYGAFDYTISDTYTFGVELNSESLLITGAGVDDLRAFGESYVEVHNTAPLEQDIGGIYTLSLDDYSTMNYYGGDMGSFRIIDNAEAVFSGGRIDYISSYQYSNEKKHITFICDVDSVNLTGNLLTGNWLDGSGFSVILQNQAGYSSVYSNINFIPEPCTLSLLGLGTLALRFKRRR